MKQTLVQQCLEIIKRDDIKNELKSILKPILEFILYEINPYIYITATLVISIFIMVLAILIILIFLIRNKEPLVKIGWNGNGDITEEMSDKAYGELYFHDMRSKMVELSKYAGLKIKSSFDFGGNLDANVKD